MQNDPLDPAEPHRIPGGVGLFGPERPAPAGAPPADRLAAFPWRAV